MIITETINNMIHAYSDLGVKIHGGSPEADYDETYDPVDLGRTYIETDIPVDETSAEEIVNILTGESE